jgi:predicted DCC family thiol-disulfide oxidoreductase YuxK
MTTHAIVYDPDCGFCRVCVAVVLRWDRGRRLRPVPGEDLDSWQLVLPDGTVVSAGAAFSPLLRLLPGGAPFALIADRFPRAAERAYRFVADHRTAFGRPLPASAKRWADRVISDRVISVSDADSR